MTNLIALSSIGCLVLVGITFDKYIRNSVKSEESLSRIAERLGVEQDWRIVRDALYNEIYCNVLTGEITLTEIEKRIGSITDVELRNLGSGEYRLYFVEAFVPLHDVMIYVDSSERLVKRIVITNMGDYVDIDCDQY